MLTLSDVRAKYPEYADLTDAQLVAGLHQKFYADMPFAYFARKIGADSIADEAMYAQSAKAQEAVPGVQNFDAAVGGALAGIPLGVREILGRTKPGEFEQWRAAMKGLWGTTGGKVGTVVGGAVPATVAMMAPGANTVVGAGLVGAGTGLLQPTGEAGLGARRALNTAIGGATSAGTQYGMNKLGQLLADRAAAKAAAAAVPEDAVRQATVQEVTGAGYKVPPSQIRPRAPGLINKVAEGVAGKLQTQQAFSVENAPLTTQLAKQDLGIPPDTPLTQAAIEAVRKPANAAYEAISKVGTIPVDDQFAADFGQVVGPYLQLKGDFPKAATIPKVDALIEDISGKPQIEANSLVALVRRLRKDGFRRIGNPFSDPEAQLLGKVELGTQRALEDLVDRHLQKSGEQGLLASYRNARVLLAKSHSVENALDEATGQVVAGRIGKEFAKGAPLTGNLATIGKMATTFPKAVQNITASPPGFSPFDLWASAGALMTGHPKTAATLLGRPVVRAAMMSAPWQQLAVAGPGQGLGSALPLALQDEYARLLASAVAPALLRHPQ